MSDLTGFDASKHEDMRSFKAIPPRDYAMQIISSEKKISKSNPASSYLQLVTEVISGEFKGARVYTILNLWNTNQTAVDIANQELATICRAVGVNQPRQSEALHKIPFIGSVDLKPAEGQYPEKNVMSNYKPYNPKKAAELENSSQTNQTNQSIQAMDSSSKPPWEVEIKEPDQSFFDAPEQE
jgi:hypothetical protein